MDEDYGPRPQQTEHPSWFDTGSSWEEFSQATGLRRNDLTGKQRAYISGIIWVESLWNGVLAGAGKSFVRRAAVCYLLHRDGRDG